MNRKAALWLGIGSALILVFVVLPSLGPLTLADGREFAFPGLRVTPNGLIQTFSDPMPPIAGALPVGRHSAALEAIADGAPLEGGSFVLSTTRPAKSAYTARWTLWTKFTVNGQPVRESTFVFRMLTGSHISTPTVTVTHAGVLESMGAHMDPAN